MFRLPPWSHGDEQCNISLKDVLAKLTDDEATGSSLDTKVDSVSEPESETEPQSGAVVDSGAYKNFASTTTVFFILSVYFS